MLMDAISTALSQAYPDIPVYTERVVQGMMTTPCFSVLVINAGQYGLIGNRYQATWLIMVRFFPGDDGSKSSYTELHEIAQNLYGILDEIGGLNDIYFGQRMAHRIEGNVLQFQVSYTFLLQKDMPDVPVMQQLESNVKVGES